MAVSGPTDNDRPDEAHERIARLYREAAREEPPARLDRAIAAAAREKPGASPSGARTPWWLPWRLPFAVAAVAVVSVSLVTVMIEDDRGRVTTLEQGPPPPVEKPQAVPQAPPAKPEPIPGAPVAARMEADRSVQRETTEARERVAIDEASARPAPAETRKQTMSPAGQAASQAPAAAPPPPAVAQDAMRDAPAPARADSQAGARYETSRPLSAERAAQAPEPLAERGVVAPAAPPAPATGPSPFPAAKPTPRMAAGGRAMEEQALGRLARPSPEVARHLIELDKQPPAMWIERVLALRKEGRNAEADGVLAEFKLRFPDIPLPPELR